jgi:hypothetical protein
MMAPPDLGSSGGALSIASAAAQWFCRYTAIWASLGLYYRANGGRRGPRLFAAGAITGKHTGGCRAYKAWCGACVSEQRCELMRLARGDAATFFPRSARTRLRHEAL